VLASLAIRNFVLIEDAVLEFGPGLTVLSGETGAGKTLLTHALGLLIGERAEEGLVGAAGEEAYIQAVFTLDEMEFSRMPDAVRDLTGINAAGDLIVSRRLSRQGRNRCYINDTLVTLQGMEQVTAHLLSFAGQHEHRRLLDPAYQLDLLDEWAGPAALATRRAFAAAFDAARHDSRRLDELRSTLETRLREIDLLTFQTEELASAHLSLAEESALSAEQLVLARTEDILRGGGLAATFLSGEGDQPDVSGLLLQASSQLNGLAGLDGRLDILCSSLIGVQHEITEIARELRSLLARTVADPERLSEIDDRLRLYSDMGRKYGGSTEAAIAYYEDGLRRLEALAQSGTDVSRLAESLSVHTEESLRLAVSLGEHRRKAAVSLERAIADQLAALGMTDGSVEIAVRGEPRWENLRDSGADSINFLFSANAGQTPRPLARGASGGELSRVLLAIKCALAGQGGHETLVFDEIDAGIGGRTAVAVGQRLEELARHVQVIVVTHLAQVAARAGTHFVVDKTEAPSGTVTRLSSLSDDDAVEEICRMMGGRREDEKAMAHARQLRDRARTGLID